VKAKSPKLIALPDLEIFSLLDISFEPKVIRNVARDKPVCRWKDEEQRAGIQPGHGQTHRKMRSLLNSLPPG
jgi:hypothetical protein